MTNYSGQQSDQAPLLPRRWAGQISHANLPTGTVTLLFTDVEGSTRLLQQLGDGYAAVLQEYRHLLRGVFREFHGIEVDTQGDAFFLAFARATDAVSAAVAAQHALTAHAWPEGVVVRVRMGLHTGEPQPSSQGYVGLDVHHAARIMTAGHGGQVLLSQTTRDLVEQALPEDVHLRDLGVHRLKDLQSPAHFFQLVITGLPTDFPPLKTLDASPNNLPVQPTPFIGREKEVAAVTALLDREDVRLLTLTGPGGTGKTRLGLQVAAELSERFPDGVYFVNLAPISDPALVVPIIAQTLDVKETAGQPLLNLLREFLREKQLLLLLDNFEQVVSASVYVADLLTVCPKLKVIVTSRAVLHVRGEQEFAVPPLAIPDPKHLPDLMVLSQYEAVALFILRAQAVKSEFQVSTANAPALAEICARLDGLPLAIELAAARTNVLPPQALLARLDQRLAVLTSGARDAPARQQTLRKTIEWSYQLLDVDEQRLFQRLSVFVGGCTLAAIEAVCAALQSETTAVSVLDGVASLVDKSLLQQREQTDGEPRYVMLETIREYGLEALERTGEGEVIRQAYAAYHLGFAEAADLGFSSPQQTAWLEHLEREHDNLRAALQWLLEHGEVEQNREVAVRLAGALSDFWRIRGHGSEGQHFLERALAVGEGVAAPMRAKVLRVAGRMALQQDDYERAEVLCKESLVLCTQLGDIRGIAHSLHLLAFVARDRGNLTRAGTLFEEALALRRKLGNKEDIAWSLLQWGILICRQGEYARAKAFFEESLGLFRELAHPHAIGWSLNRLAEMCFLSGGDPAIVRSLLAESLPLFRAVGEKSGIMDYFYLSGRLALNRGDAPTARSLAEQGLAISREIGLGEPELLSFLGEVEARQGNYATAHALYEESLTIARRAGRQVDIASYLEGLAGVVAAQGEPTWAARLWGAAEAVREATGAPLPPVERADYERSMASARAQLGEQAFATAWAEGRAMTPELALAARGLVALPGGAKSASHAAPSSHIVPPTPTYPDGLTAREVEVLRLVAQGLTNAQIAERLIISPTTVNAHMRSLYSKVAVNTRIALMRYATEHHLT
jgi:predicted ATPase/class 3 adenylate cyclase/DNA-binding CsgD family transcriptional regulator